MFEDNYNDDQEYTEYSFDRYLEEKEFSEDECQSEGDCSEDGGSFYDTDYHPTLSELIEQQANMNRIDRIREEVRPNHYITKTDITDLKIVLETSLDVNDFVKNL